MKYFFVQNNINEWYIVPVTLKAAWEDMVNYGTDEDKKDDFDLMFGEYLNGSKSLRFTGQ